jgi:alpha-glucosidase (family GH31 glycosyl hydrolase)
VDDQWLFGRDLLVAPIMDAGLRRTVYLPPGTWYDWWTGAATAGGRWIEAEAALDRIPLWLREGAIVPLGDVHQWVGDAPDHKVELVLTPLDADGERRLDFTINGHSINAVLIRRLGQYSLTLGQIPNVIVTPRWVGGALTTFHECGQSS